MEELSEKLPEQQLLVQKAEEGSVQPFVKRYAFIDVQNTETTTEQMLRFNLDSRKLFEYLRSYWNCEKIFFYPGIQHGNNARRSVFQELSDMGAIVRPKNYFVYKNPKKTIFVKCPQCRIEILKTFSTGHSWKCNCDVELSVDVLEHVGPDTELLLFTGDGDFEFLIEKAIEKRSKIVLISSARKIQKGSRYFSSRFSTKLRDLIARDPLNVKFIEIGDWESSIKNDQGKTPSQGAGVF